MSALSLWGRLAPQELEIVKRATASYPVRVAELAQQLGLTVVRAPLPPNISGLIQPSATAPAGFEIKVNKYEAPERQRFTVAHEIAHYLLHRDLIGAGVVDSVMYRSNLTSRNETEANRFAADIVMPAEHVRAELTRTGGVATSDAADTLARIFKVSPPAMRIRLGIA